jgi:hypothetical protein
MYCSFVLVIGRRPDFSTMQRSILFCSLTPEPNRTLMARHHLPEYNRTNALQARPACHLEPAFFTGRNDHAAYHAVLRPVDCNASTLIPINNKGFGSVLHDYVRPLFYAAATRTSLAFEGGGIWSGDACPARDLGCYFRPLSSGCAVPALARTAQPPRPAARSPQRASAEWLHSSKAAPIAPTHSVQAGCAASRARPPPCPV